MATGSTSINDLGGQSSNMPTPAGLITFRADGSNGKADVDITVTESGGKLTFLLKVVNGQNNLAALHSVYFNINGFDLGEASTFEITGTDVFGSQIVADSVKDLQSGNVNGQFSGPFDVGVSFTSGSSNGRGQSDIYSASFTLSDTSERPLTLGLVSKQLFGIRLVSPDDKIEVLSAQAPGNSLPSLQTVTFPSGTEDNVYTIEAADLIKDSWDSDGDVLSVTGIAVTSGGGSIVKSADGVWTYTPALNYNGPVVLQYSVFDGKGTVTSFANLTLAAINDAPVATPVTLPDGQEGQPVKITAGQLLAGASDVDGDKLTISSLSLKADGGTLTADGDGTWTYVPDAQHNGQVSFDYTVSDGLEKASSTASLMLNPVKTAPNAGGSEALGLYDDLIEAGDGDDIIHGGRGNDEMQGEGGNDTIIGGTDNGRLEWADNTLTKVVIGDNLYGNDGADTYFYEKGDGVDLIWDFRPDADTIVLGYSSQEIIGAAYVSGVTNRIKTPDHDKIALILGRGDKVSDAIVINDFGGLRDSDRKAFMFADGVALSMKEVLALIDKTPVASKLPTTWTGVAAAGQTGGRAANSLDLYGNNDTDTLIGRTGDDRLYGNEGFNQLNGNDGSDELYGGNVSDIVIGGKGNDFGYGNGGADTIVGGVGSDKLYGDGGADIIYGDTDTSDDGHDISHGGFGFKFNLGLQDKYRALFDSAEPVDGIGVTPDQLVITPGKNWWGGFEVTLTVKADASLAGWSLFLNSAYEITSIWGAEISPVRSGSTSALYELKNASWNGSLSKGQTTTIGFTVRTPFNIVVDDRDLLLKGLKIGTSATLDAGVASAVSSINNELSKLKTVTATDSYTLLGTEQKLVAASGNKAIDLAGNKLGNVIVGNDGDNEIAGRAGKDTLTGKKGKDAFVFDTKLSTANLDKVTDFSAKDDSFYLDHEVFKKLGKGSEAKPVQLKKSFFTIGTEAKDKNDYIVYNKDKGVLLYDDDGSGSGKAIEFAQVKKDLALTHKDFFVV